MTSPATENQSIVAWNAEGWFAERAFTAKSWSLLRKDGAKSFSFHTGKRATTSPRAARNAENHQYQGYQLGDGVSKKSPRSRQGVAESRKSSGRPGDLPLVPTGTSFVPTRIERGLWSGAAVNRCAIFR
jgi:hypothetical protein